MIRLLARLGLWLAVTVSILVGFEVGAAIWRGIEWVVGGGR